MKVLNRLVLGILSMILATCTSTDISSFRDPGFVNYVKKVMIVYSSDNLNKKNEIETLFRGSLMNESDIIAVRELDLLPPLREYTHEERMKVLNNAKVDAILIPLCQGSCRLIFFYLS